MSHHAEHIPGDLPQHEHGDGPSHGRTAAITAADWDARYSGERVWSGKPNQALVDEASELPAGRALDIGCGEGADSVWLARRGWEVTALDISAKAIERTLAAAREADTHLTGVASPFSEAVLPSEGFDLVSAMYPVLPLTDDATEQRLLDLVAPGGTLLFVHHEGIDPEHSRAQGIEPDDHLWPADVAAAVRNREGWELVAEESRERHVAEGQGAHHHSDLVVVARRLA